MLRNKTERSLHKIMPVTENISLNEKLKKKNHYINLVSPLCSFCAI